MAEVNYNTEKLIAGAIKTDQVTLTAGTYTRGNIVSYSGGKYSYESTVPSSGAFGLYLGNAASEQVVKTGDFQDDIIVAGDVSALGIVDNSNTVIALTEDDIQAFRDNNIFIKRA
jgi:hypothetical protein